MSAGCAFADYDNDGYLDLYVSNYLQFDFEKERVCKHRNIISYCDPRDYVGIPDTLYHNNGDGTFTDVTREAGVYNPIGHGLGVVFGDYNNDGYIDLYVANDTTQNFLYHNNGDGTFTDVSLFAGVGFSEHGRAESSMGTDFGDYDNDGYLDIIVTNFQDEINTLYHNDGNGFFSDVSFTSGIGAATLKYMGWGANFFDYDNDGDEDLIFANGHLFDNVEMFDDIATYPQINQLCQNDGNGKFTVVSAQAGPGFSSVKVSRGAVLGDYDNDGDIDILITNSNQTIDLLRNEGGNRNHWLMIKTIGTKSNRDGIGARVTVTVGEQSFIDEVRSGSGYIGQNDMRVMFGLGRNTKVDSIHIRWPSGIEDVIKNVAADQLLIVTEGQSEKIKYSRLSW
ncbi:TPA: CRTAC1 family protein [Candidatus Poribacteria bacterium]|nr:CRTAC1 family protein [Candidatus Poribacteria bacterium]